MLPEMGDSNLLARVLQSLLSLIQDTSEHPAPVNRNLTTLSRLLLDLMQAVILVS
jgi:hypothetical protein